MNATSVARPERHFVSVWNPSIADDAMEQHLELLLSLAREHDAGQRDADDLYIWWGKVRSPNRQTPQVHLDDARSVAEELDAGARVETQLYLTDYRSLYVADVDAIHFGDLPDAESAHVPGYYRREKLGADYWFRVLDIRRLVADDLNGVIRELRALHNVHYNDRPVSLYGGMVDLPLFVTRPDGRRFFDEDERDAMTGDRLWAEFDAEVGTGIAAVERELRDNLFGERAWLALDMTARTFIATGEGVFRAHRADSAFDFGPVIGSFAKALEVQVNAALRAACGGLSAQQRLANVGGQTVDLFEFRPLTLGELAGAIGGERALNDALRGRLENGAWFTGSLPAILDDFRPLRNDGIHASRVDRATAVRWRDRLLGVGCAGDFVELSRVRVKSGSGGSGAAKR